MSSTPLILTPLTLMPLTLIPMQAQDQESMESLLRQTFGPGRLALPAYGLRCGPPLDRLSWVARSPQGRVLGCLRFWPVCLEGGAQRAVLLGPLGVDRAYRGMGVAATLVRFGLNRATDLGFELCFVVGEPRFYSRFGFTNAAWSGIDSAVPIPPQRLQVRELRPTALRTLSNLGRRQRLAAQANPCKTDS